MAIEIFASMYTQAEDNEKYNAFVLDVKSHIKPNDLLKQINAVLGNGWTFGGVDSSIYDFSTKSFVVEYDFKNGDNSLQLSVGTDEPTVHTNGNNLQYVLSYVSWTGVYNHVKINTLKINGGISNDMVYKILDNEKNLFPEDEMKKRFDGSSVPSSYGREDVERLCKKLFNATVSNYDISIPVAGEMLFLKFGGAQGYMIHGTKEHKLEYFVRFTPTKIKFAKLQKLVNELNNNIELCTFEYISKRMK